MQYDARPKEANDESALLGQPLQCRYQGPIVIIMGNGNMRTVSTMPCLSSSSCHLQIQVACDVYIMFRISDLY